MTCPASAPTCRTISTCSSSPSAPAITPTTTTPSRTVRRWAGLQYLLFKQGTGRLEPVRDRRLLVRRPDRASPDIQFHLGLGSGIEAGVAKLPQCRRDAELRLPAPALARHRAARSADPGRSPADRPELLVRSPRPRMSIAGLRLARDIMRQPALEALRPREVLPGPTAADATTSCSTMPAPAPRPTIIRSAPAAWA